MLTTGELRALIGDRESDRVERMVSKSKTDKFGEAICAFANDFPNYGRPGYLIIGVDDDRVSGIAVTEEMLRNLSALASNVNLEPLPAITVQPYTLPEGEVVVVEVTPSDLPPVHYKGQSLDSNRPIAPPREPERGADSGGETDCRAADP